MRPLVTIASAAASLALPAAASAQVFLDPPNFAGPPVSGSEPGISLPLPGANAAEYNAALIWNLRAGLNVAALQCQYSPFLGAVENYNSLLNRHSGELGQAYRTLEGFFLRGQTKKVGSKAFDDYNTRTYNGFSTLYAQRGFCHTAASIGRELMFTPIGGLGGVAQRRMREFRNSLVAIGDRAFATTTWYLPTPQLPVIPAECFDRRGKINRRCADQYGL